MLLEVEQVASVARVSGHLMPVLDARQRLHPVVAVALLDVVEREHLLLMVVHLVELGGLVSGARHHHVHVARHVPRYQTRHCLVFYSRQMTDLRNNKIRESFAATCNTKGCAQERKNAYAVE